MEALINAIQQNRPVEARRVDGASASKQQDTRVEAEQPTSETRAAEPRRVERADVERASERLNEALDSFSKDLAISVHGDTGRLTVRVTDPKTGDVIRELPPEQLLEAEVTIDKIIGLFVNDEV
jgi:flagellar protein FlaG